METYNNTNNTTTIEAAGLRAGGQNSCNCGNREENGNGGCCRNRENRGNSGGCGNREGRGNSGGCGNREGRGNTGCCGNREGRGNSGGYENHEERGRDEDCGCCENHENTFEQQLGLQFLPLLSNSSNPYFLNKLGRYFKGQGCQTRISENQKAYYILKNSHKSKHNIFVNSYDFANLSGSAIKVTLYCCGELSPCADFSEEHGISGNSTCCNRQNNTPGKILTIDGTCENPIKCGTPITTFTVAPYETFTGTPEGSIALGKGDMLIAELSGFCPRETAYASGSFEWWSEPIDKCSPFGLSCPR